MAEALTCDEVVVVDLEGIRITDGSDIELLPSAGFGFARFLGPMAKGIYLEGSRKPKAEGIGGKRDGEVILSLIHI